MKRTKLVSVAGNQKSIEERVKEVLEQYFISQESLIDVRIAKENDGRTTALIIYDPDKRNL
ncbi:MAG: hypothetical protein WAV55_01890 [Clostridiaceae bacterium]